MSAALPPRHIFRAYDIRGVVGEDLTTEGVYQIGQAIGSEARERGVGRIALGRDGRLSGEVLARALCDGLTAAGVDVLDVGEVATPILYYAAHTRCDGSGVMLTGSHNPPQYNGIKVMLAADTLYGEAVTALHDRLQQRRLCRGSGKVSTVSITDDYYRRILGDVRLARPLKVVVDGGNGVAGGFAVALLTALGCQVVAQYCEVDGRFPHHHPDPNREENLRDLRDRVVAERADLGIALDGDGDRIGVVDDRGKVIWPDRLLMYLAERVLQQNPGAIVIYDVKCSRALGEVIRRAGGQALMWKSGHSYAKAKLKQVQGVLAGELSGHVFYNDRWYGFDDALYTAARLIELLALESEPASTVFARYPEPLSTPELHIAMAEGEAEVLMAALSRHLPFDDARVFSVDGLRVEFQDGWALVRASNTTPTLVVRCEADNAAALAAIQARLRAWLLTERPGLALPF